MITKLKGTVEDITPDSVTIDVQGVGYLVICSQQTQQALTNAEGIATLYIEHQFRQDMQQLFGFFIPEERDCFRLLQTVQGVGGRVAIAILSVLAPDRLVEAIACQDKAALAQAEGVGPKLAARITNELKDRVQKLGIRASRIVTIPTSKTVVLHDVASALVNLGYRPAEATAGAQQAILEHGTDGNLDDLIRTALRHLTKAG